MEMRVVASSNIAQVGYDKDKQELLVMFRNGSKYLYTTVPESVADELITAASVGKYFNANVRTQYPFTKVG